MISGSQLGSSQPVDVTCGAVMQEVGTIESRLESLASLILDLESALHQILQPDQIDGCANGTARPSPATPLANRLECIGSGVENLASRVSQILRRVDI